MMSSSQPQEMHSTDNRSEHQTVADVPSGVPADHPIVTGNYAVYTLAISAMMDSVCRWIRLREEGGVIVGPTRYGKSWALIYWLGAELQKHFGPLLPWIVWGYTGASTSKGAMCASILQAFAHRYPVSHDGGVKNEVKLIEAFIAIAENARNRMAILIIDESQDMSEREWIWLVQLHSSLQAEKVQLCVISVASYAQYNEKGRQLAMVGTGRATARFMLNEHQFKGVDSKKALQYILDGYDEHCTWPSDSNTSLTQGVVENAYDAGFRLGNYADKMWKGLIKACPEGFKGPNNFPMRSIAAGVRQKLFDIALGQPYEKACQVGAWEQTFIQVQHRSLMKVVNPYIVVRPGRK